MRWPPSGQPHRSLHADVQRPRDTSAGLVVLQNLQQVAARGGQELLVCLLSSGFHSAGLVSHRVTVRRPKAFRPDSVCVNRSQFAGNLICRVVIAGPCHNHVATRAFYGLQANCNPATKLKRLEVRSAPEIVSADSVGVLYAADLGIFHLYSLSRLIVSVLRSYVLSEPSDSCNRHLARFSGIFFTGRESARFQLLALPQYLAM